MTTLAHSKTEDAGLSNKGVCFILESFYPVVHGGATQIRLLGELLARQGVNVTVITRRTSLEQKLQEKFRRMNIIRVKPAVGMRPVGKYLMLGPVVWALAKERKSYDYILISDIKVLGAVGVVASKFLRKVCILRASSCGEIDGSYAYASVRKESVSALKLLIIRILVTLRNPILKMADAYLSIASVITCELVKGGIPREKIVDFACGVDTEFFRPPDSATKSSLRNRLKLPEKAIFIYTGRLAEGKGLQTLIDVWRRVVDWNGDVFLLLVGSGQGFAMSCEGKLKETVRAKQLEGHVRFVGKVDNVKDYLNASDCFVFPTEYEALGNSLLEAMSCGLICIATRVGGIVDVIEHGANGLLFDRGDEEGLFEAIKAVVSDRVRIQLLSERARTTIVEKFNIDRKVKALRELLDSSADKENNLWLKASDTRC